MIRTVIIEDEAIIADYLETALVAIDPQIRVISRLGSVAEGVEFFSKTPDVELIFCDVQLRDGLSFSIFETLSLNVPIIFVTAYDSFVLKAFEKNGIGYLLKPVSDEDLTRAVNKYKALQIHFTAQLPTTVSADMRSSMQNRPKTRILAKKGGEHLPLLLTEVVFFYTENRVVLAADASGRRYLVDKTLSDLEEELDKGQFFRANRQYLLNILYIKSYKPYERVKLWVELTVNTINYSIVVSQCSAASFRHWLEKA